jgi:hypothetical protein
MYIYINDHFALNFEDILNIKAQTL